MPWTLVRGLQIWGNVHTSQSTLQKMYVEPLRAAAPDPGRAAGHPAASRGGQPAHAGRPQAHQVSALSQEEGRGLPLGLAGRVAIGALSQDRGLAALLLCRFVGHRHRGGNPAVLRLPHPFRGPRHRLSPGVLPRCPHLPSTHI
jgi:hypothetical protein